MNKERAMMDIWAIADAEEKEGFKLMLVPIDKGWWMNTTDVKIGTQSIEFTAPDSLSREEMARKAIETLRDRQKQIKAEAYKKEMELEQRIQELLMITHQPDDDNVIDLEVGRV